MEAILERCNARGAFFVTGPFPGKYRGAVTELTIPHPSLHILYLFITESKMRADALTELLDMLLSGNLDTTSYDLAQQITAAITPSLADNNVKAATTAAASLEALARALPESVLRGQLDALAPHLTDLLGNAKVSQSLT